MWKFIVDLFRRAATPPLVPSTTPELTRVEAEIEADAARVAEDVHVAVLERARSMVGKGRYCLGAGGKRPDAEAPWSTCVKPTQHAHKDLGTTFCDCSGFVNWCWRLPRLDKTTGEWRYTDNYELWGRKQGIAWKDARPGDVVAYGAGAAIGHCGIVSEVDDAGPVKVIHCQASKRPAVVEGDAEFFARKKAVIWRPR